ncbi:MAG: hypothetical protein OHK0039_39000 [Bacteroidia bacterium]
MFRFFRRKENGKSAGPALSMTDLDGEPLAPGDLVESLRYDLGVCRILADGPGYSYESLQSGEQVSYLRMVDAATSRQKVRKIQ